MSDSNVIPADISETIGPATAPAFAPARIGSGAFSLIVGFLSLGLAVAVGALGSDVGASGSDLADATQAAAGRAILGGFGSFLIFTGFFKWLFHMIERRLMDVEKTLRESGDDTPGSPP